MASIPRIEDFRLLCMPRAGPSANAMLRATRLAYLLIACMREVGAFRSVCAYREKGGRFSGLAHERCGGITQPGWYDKQTYVSSGGLPIKVGQQNSPAKYLLFSRNEGWCGREVSPDPPVL